jgi:hypothetical protein
MDKGIAAAARIVNVDVSGSKYPKLPGESNRLALAKSWTREPGFANQAANSVPSDGSETTVMPYVSTQGSARNPVRWSMSSNVNLISLTSESVHSQEHTRDYQTELLSCVPVTKP